jgi:hypothetical protein
VFVLLQFSSSISNLTIKSLDFAQILNKFFYHFMVKINILLGTQFQLHINQVSRHPQFKKKKKTSTNVIPQIIILKIKKF